MDDESNWQRQVLVGLTVLVAVGALIGGVVALVSIKAADMAGISGDTSSSQPPDRRAIQPSDDADGGGDAVGLRGGVGGSGPGRGLARCVGDPDDPSARPSWTGRDPAQCPHVRSQMTSS